MKLSNSPLQKIAAKKNPNTPGNKAVYKDPLLVKGLKRFDGLWGKLGIDASQLYAILRLKLLMDDRRNSVNSNSNGKKSKLTGAKANLLVQFIFGFMMAILMAIPLDLFYRVTTIVAMNFFFMVMYMVSDFSNVLLDVRDKDIIMTKGVSDKTMNTARIIHVSYYLLIMFFALNIMSIVVAVVKDGPLSLVAFLLLLILMSFFVIFLTTILYSLILERFSGEKLKDIINMFQVVLSVATVVGYQFVGRVFNFIDFNMTVSIKWWTYILPPFWYSSMFKVIVEGDLSRAYVIMTIIGIIVPVVMAVLFFKVILTRYEGYLAKLQVEDGVYIPKNQPIKNFLFKLMSKDHVERAFIRFSDANLSRDRMVKRMIYPNYALGIAFPFIMILSFARGSGLTEMANSRFYLYAYLGAVLFVTNFQFVQFSEHHQASFIYDSFPIEDKSVILRGAAKAYFIKFVLPGLLILNVVFGVLCGVRSIPGLILIDVMSYLLLALKIKISTPQLPFSKEPHSTGNQDLGATFGLMIIAGAMAGIHYVIDRFAYPGQIIAIILAVVVSKVLFSSLVNLQKGLESKA